MGLRYMLYILLLLIFRNVFVSSFGMCGRSQRRYELDGKVYYYREIFCCNDFENVNGICKECSPGFITREGGTCYPCPRWNYGYRCKSWCHCKENQRCHNVYGCIEDIQFSTEVYRKHGDTTTIEHSAPTSGMETATLMNACLGMIQTEVFIYSLVGFSTFLILCFSIGCFCVHKKYHKAFIHRHSEIDQNIGVNNRIYEVDNNVGISQHVLRESANSNEYEDIQHMQ